MKVIILGKIVTFRCAHSKETMEMVSKFKPESLILKDEDGKPIFALGLSSNAAVGKYGISFDTTDENGNVQVSVVKEGTVTREEVQNDFADIIAKAKKIEDAITRSLTEIRELKASVASCIESI